MNNSINIPLFVISLKKDTSKRKHIEKEFSNHNLKFTFFDGVDGKTLTEYPINLNWYEPWYHNHTTMGEVGCTLSHIGVWEKMITENIEKALIFEDDIVILNSDMLNLTQHIPTEYDFVYLGRKKIGNKNEEQVVILNDTLKDIKMVKPSFSYWCCGYYLTLQGAKKLCKDNFYKNNIIISDEFVPFMMGQSPYMERLSNYKFLLENDNQLNALAFVNPLVKPRNNAFNYSSTFFSNPVPKWRKDVLLVSVGTDQNECVDRYISSCHKFGFNPIVLGLNDEWKGGDMANGIGGGHKINFLKEYMDALPATSENDNKILIFTDSYDVIANNNVNVLMDAYNKNYKDSVVFGTEKTCWPDSELANHYPHPFLVTKNGEYIKYKCKNRFLNSGVFMGPVKYIRELLKDSIKNTEDDQLYYTQCFLNKVKYNFDIKLDYQNKLFVCLHNATDYNINEQMCCFEIDDERPAFIHGNGPRKVKLLLNKIANYTVNGFNNTYGYKMNKSAEVNFAHQNKEPSILVVYDESLGFYFPSFYSFLTLNYDKKKINLLYLYKEHPPKHKLNACYKIQEQHGLKEDEDNIDYRNLSELFNTYDEIPYGADIKSDYFAFDKVDEFKTKYKSDYVFYMNTITVLTNKNTLYYLLEEDKNVIGPMITQPNNFQANFWGAVDANNYYRRSSDYFNIIKYEKISCWNMPYLWYCFLMKGKFYNRKLFNTNHDKGDGVDMAFAYNMRESNYFMWVLNTNLFGEYIDIGDRKDTYKVSDVDKIASENVKIMIYDDTLNTYNNTVEWEEKYLTREFLDIFYSRNNKTKDDYFSPDENDLIFIPMFTEKFCSEVLNRANKNNQWSKGGDNYYDKRLGAVEVAPTRDIHLNQIKLENMWKHVIDKYISNVIWNIYKYSTKGINIVFVVKYSMDGQKDLKPHHDASTYTVNLCLNNDFEGGGCEFINKNVKVINKHIGRICIHPGKYTHRHRGMPLTSGERYILISFVD